MSSQLNAQVSNTLDVVKQATLSPTTIVAAGAGKAYQSVAQSAAIAIQDAVDLMRNVNTISTTALGVATAQFLAGGDADKYTTAITNINTMMGNVTTNFNTVGTNAASILKSFPPAGSSSSGGGGGGGSPHA